MINSFKIRIFLPLVGICAVVVIWWLSLYLGLINSFFLPWPSAVLKEFIIQWKTGNIPDALCISLERVTLSLVLGIIFGVIIGVIFGRWQALRATFIFWIEFLRALPVTALLPLLIALFSTGQRPLLVACTLTAFLIMFVNTVEATKGIPDELQQLARLVNLNFWQKWKSIYFPSMLPQLSQGVRNAISVTFIVVVVSEIIMGVGNGLGYSINKPSLSFKLDETFALVFVTGFVGWLINAIYQYASDRFIHWRGK